MIAPKIGKKFRKVGRLKIPKKNTNMYVIEVSFDPTLILWLCHDSNKSSMPYTNNTQ